MNKTPADTLAALAPCPFCGHHAKLIESAEAPGKYGSPSWKVECDFPFRPCVGGFINLWMKTPEEAIAAWNRRASLKGEAVDPVDRYLSLSMRHLAAEDDDGSACEALWKEMTQDQRDEANRIVSAAINSMDTTPPAPQAVGDDYLRGYADGVRDAYNAIPGDVHEKGLEQKHYNAALRNCRNMIRELPAPSPAPQGGVKWVGYTISDASGIGSNDMRRIKVPVSYDRDDVLDEILNVHETWARDMPDSARGPNIYMDATPPAQQPLNVLAAWDAMADSIANRRREMGENIWRPSPGREGLFYEVWKLKWSDAFGSAYQCAKNAAGFRKKFWTLKGAQAYADKLNGATHEH